MDIQLPGMSGIECTAALKLKLPALRVMMLTVYEDSDAIFDALKAGTSGYLLKRSAPTGSSPPSRNCTTAARP